jgi:hypothetical protein
MARLPGDRERRERMASVLFGGQVAMMFVSDPDIWPAFAAWAERKIPGIIWDENDRQCMAADALVMNILGERLDA